MSKKSYIIGGVVIVFAMVMAARSFKSTLTTYVTVKEAKMTDQPVQVAGIAVQGTKKYDFDRNVLIFTLREDSGDEMVVEYAGSKPANFDDVNKIVVIGKYAPQKQVFQARQLLVKCPTKYEGRVKGK
ncbi:MAG: cytochrome c maturation protein CcmE [Deltaproteobacteria bacterium]|nr:cytochrome c maturation protein CcmE [Deltaproteobacteria bacterium]RLB89160.1 MAG: cytochrome c maturation protein CcmE [Deltaproteobacteria bacterium]RLC12295.1 MAG: cytochrome c maturation protein CcmE [Deltaproteobacteria bacterium]